MNIRSTLLNLTGLSLIAFSTTTHASNVEQSKPLQTHQSIINTAQSFVSSNLNKDKYSRIEIKMGRLDSRLRLSQCNLPLTTSLAPGSRFFGKSTIHVRCNDEKPWTVYINAHIKLYSEVVKTAIPLDKGHILGADDLTLVEEDLSQLKYGYFTDRSHLIGKQLKRRLNQNKTLKAQYVKAPTLVKRGEIVTIVAENTGYSVKMSGTAMMSGSYGDRIRVKNTSSKRVIEGVVKESGVVSIN